MTHIAYIGIGSNMDNPLEQCRKAMRLIAAHVNLELEKCSSFYRTEPVGVTNQDWFINSAVSVKTDLTPPSLLSCLMQMEEEMGRTRELKWGPRVIDLDLLFYDDQPVDIPGLSIPHPEIQNRRFILAPMNEIAGDLIHPLLMKSIAQLLAELPETPKAIRL